jgi:alpha,alpha-trehalase
MSTTPIGDYALLSDRHSAALVSRAGSIDWLCLPRFDRPSVFGRLLGDQAGHWSIQAVGRTQVTRRYLDRTMVLETTTVTPDGTVVMTDALAMGAGNRGHDLGKNAPHLLLRRVTCTAGEVDLDLEYAPRPEYGLGHPQLRAVDGGLAAIENALVLSSPEPLIVDASSATGRIHLRRGESIGFALHYGNPDESETARVWAQAEIAARLDDSVSAWQSWSELHQAYVGPWRDLVHHSGRVLQALSFAPTGAICAAATTSLPEVVGGSRNWDYRYAWVRDTSFTIEALWVAACPDEANQFFDYMSTAAAGSLERGEDLQIMFGIGGERDLTERELPHLEGWRDSAPVRVGNGAWQQRQLDVYGELLNAVYRVSDHIFDATARVGPTAGPGRWDTDRVLTPATRQFFVDLADAAVRRWPETDQGIWEVRGEARHFVYSKLMCWVALDRAVAMADQLGASPRVADWTQARDQIRQAILTRGWSDRANAFTQIVRIRRAGRLELDAAAGRVPAGRRPSSAGHHRRHRGAPDRRARTGLSLPRG